MRLFGRKEAPKPQQLKSASFFFSPGAGKAGLSGADYARLADDGYLKCLVAFACITKIASAVASVEPQLYQKRKGGKLDKLDDHDLLDLLEAPNPAQSGKEFLRHLVSYHQLAGTAFVAGVSRSLTRGSTVQPLAQPPGELQLLPPGRVEVKPGGGFFPLAYEYKPDATTRYVYPVDQVNGRSALLHLKTFHPLNASAGLSALWPAALSVDIHTAGQEWNKRLIENGARPSGAMVVKKSDGSPAELTEEQYLRVKEMIDRQFTGAANAGRPLLLEGGLEWQEMSLNPKDMEFLEGKHSAARDIALAFGVPPQLLGIPGDSTFANYEQATLSFWSDTVLPLYGIILEGFNRWLAPLYGKGLFLWYDEETIPALEPRRKQKADRINAAGYMTINEKRRAMGLDDIAGGNTVLVPSASIPLELAGAVDLPEPGSAADQGQGDEE